MEEMQKIIEMLLDRVFDELKDADYYLKIAKHTKEKHSSICVKAKEMANIHINTYKEARKVFESLVPEQDKHNPYYCYIIYSLDDMFLKSKEMEANI